MATPHSATLQLRGLGNLAVSERAKRSSFEELLGPGWEVDEAEVDRLVEEAKIAHQREKSKRA